ncbi:MAG: (4Fe-4S)-binding protein [Ruminococcaceae bacterium]|nr:(4Fe-4S)-binding protein [Oscillospiraceae bacterium]
MKTVECTIPSEEVARVKGLGFLRDKNTADCFNARVITRNGKLTAEKLKAIADASKLFGSGEVTMTTRMTLEIQRIPYSNIDPLREYLAKYDLFTGGTGPKVRPVVSCKGTTCQYGLIDTFALSEEIHNRFYEGYSSVKLPHKFKIAVGGCPNNCAKPDLNDVGIIGQLKPVVNFDACRGCKVCLVEKSCPMKACRVENGKITVDESLCNNCGRCKDACHFKAFAEYQNGYKIYIGGRWGKKVARGIPLSKIFTSKEEVLEMLEKIILLFKDKGIAGERLRDTIERITFETAEALLLSNELLERKEEIIEKAVQAKI